MAKNELLTGNRMPLGALAKLQVNEEVVIPPGAKAFERQYAPDKEIGDTEVVLPSFEREEKPEPELTTTPAKTTKEAAESQLDKEQAEAGAEAAAADEALRKEDLA